MGDAVALIRGEGKNLRRKEKRARIEQIRANLGLSDSQRTPMVATSQNFPNLNLFCKMMLEFILIDAFCTMNILVALGLYKVTLCSLIVN